LEIRPTQPEPEFFRANSYLILPDLLAPETVAELNAAMDRPKAWPPEPELPQSLWDWRSRSGERCR
jgi:hypothetical protein